MVRTLPAWLVGIVLLIPAVSLAKPKVGDTVKISWQRNMIDAKVVEVQKNGWYRVTFTYRGFPYKSSVPPNRVFAGGEGVEARLSEQERKDLREMRDNKDGKTVSSKEYREWHAPGKTPGKTGKVIGEYRLKAYRRGSLLILFESKAEKGKQPEEWVARLQEIASPDRREIYKLLGKNK